MGGDVMGDGHGGATAPDGAGTAEKRVTWGELFFDLVFVFAITQVSHLLHDNHTWAGLGQALVVFVPVYWAWVGVSIHANTHDVETPQDRIGIFAVGLCGLFMALALPGAYHDRGVLFGASYLVLRIILAALVFRGYRNIPVNSFSVAVLVTGPLLLVGGLVDGPARVLLWGIAAVVDLVVPRLVRSRLSRVRFHPAHQPERFGLFLIIAIGESVVAIGQAASPEPLTPARLAAVALAFILACGLWWVYFVFAAAAIHHAISTARVQTDIIRTVLAYGHVLFISAVVAVAVGLADVAAHPVEHLHLDVAALLIGGTALYLATFTYTRWRMFGSHSPTRLIAAGACLPLLAAAPYVPAVVLLGALTAIVVALNVVEWFRVKRANGSVLRVLRPEAARLDESEPGVTGPGATEPGATEPGATEPDTAERVR